jgi:hypothetical protein
MARLFDRVLICGLAAIVIIAPLLLGAVEPWGYAAAETAIFAISAGRAPEIDTHATARSRITRSKPDRNLTAPLNTGRRVFSVTLGRGCCVKQPSRYVNYKHPHSPLSNVDG